QCHGLAIFTRDENGHYTHERNIVAPERFGQDNCSPVPLTSRGKGLPSNLINDIIVAQNSASQTIWIATSAGLVKADNDLKNLEYQRGRDYAAKVHGLYGGAPKNFKAAPEVLMKRLLPEDYLTALVEDGVGQIYVGMRQNGFLISDPVSGRRWFGTQKESGLTDNFVTKIAILEDGNFLVGTYGGGVVKSTKPFNLTIRQPKKSDDLQRPNIVAQNEETRRDLPIEIKPPTIEDLKWMQKKLATLTKPLPKTHASYYGEDWKTQGDGLGRAFYNWAIMCACVSPLDREIRFFSHYYTANSFIGPNATPDDTIRRWVHWKKTDNPKVLWDPLNGYRRQSEWDDHGEAYPMSKDGPDVWYLLEVKHQGAFKLGMYFFNKDGHDGNNRWRDYVIEIYPAKAAWKGNPYDTWKQYSKEAEQVARTTPPLEKCRVRDFWGGVYKQFNLTGGFYYVKIRRNYSFNTIISAVTMDRLKGQLTHGEWCGIPFVSDMLPDESRYKYFPKRLPTDSDKIEDWHTIRFLRTLDRVYDKSGGMAVQRKWRIDTYRFAKARARTTNNEKMAKIAEYLEWTLNQWDDKQKKEWRDTMEAAFKKYYDTSPTLWKTIEEQKNGVPEFIRDRHKWE
ncbi:MAG: hypothetical protein LBQ66_03105, partial [Planctomycetaceae bacterium]|nr:hypothetical protein [Planctomycetaceae bacterium]